jgi:hypothetical protein
VVDDALASLKNEKTELLYQQGLKRIDSMLRTSKITHSAVTRNLFETKNVFYNDTVIDALEGFFKVYNPALGAHKIHITADYPVYMPVKQAAGIEFILKYLENISYENSFCLRFPPAAVHRLLCGYANGYEDIVFNIYEPLLTTAIGCVLSGTDPRLLNLTASNLKFLEKLFVKKNGREIRTLISESFVKIQKIFSFQPGVKQYIDSSLQQITSTIEIALENRTPGRIFIIPK